LRCKAAAKKLQRVKAELQPLEVEMAAADRDAEYGHAHAKRVIFDK
jgi:hypothetical protein